MPGLEVEACMAVAVEEAALELPVQVQTSFSLKLFHVGEGRIFFLDISQLICAWSGYDIIECDTLNYNFPTNITFSKKCHCILQHVDNTKKL